MKRLSKLLLVLTIIVAVSMSAFLGCSSPGSMPPEDVPPGGGGTNPPGGGNGGGNGGGGYNPGDYTFDSVAEVLAAKDRLEKVDFNFEFSMDSDTGAGQSYSTGEEYFSAATYSDVPGGAQKVFSADRDALVNSAIERSSYNMFENVSTMTEMAAQNARELADWFIENVYEMDVAIRHSVWTYYMHHDKVTDALYIEKFTDANEYVEEGYERVTIYYDSEGDEVIEIFSVNGKFINKIVSCEGKYYEVLSTFMDNYGGMELGWTDEYKFVYSRVFAYKENGFWRGMDVYCNTHFSLFSDNGAIYPGSNECLTVNSFVETELGNLVFSSNLEPRHANGQKVCGWNEETMSDENVKVDGDYYKYYTNGIEYLEGMIDSTYDQNYVPTFTISLHGLDGWDAIVADIKDDVDLERGSFYAEHMDELYLTSGGNKIPLNVWYSKQHGYLTLDGYPNFGEFTRLSDGAIIPTDEMNFGECVEVSAVVGLNAQCDKIERCQLSFYVHSLDYWDSEKGEYIVSADVMTEEELQLIEYYLNEVGLTSGMNGISLPRLMINAFYDGNTITSNMFEKAMGFDISDPAENVSGFREYTAALIAEGENFQNSGRQALLDSYVTEDFSEDKLNAFKALGASILEISGNISGSVVVVDGEMNFEGLTVTLPRSTILSSNRNYVTVVTFSVGNDSATIPVYQNQDYSGNNLTFMNSGRFALPENLTTGTYVLSAYYARGTEDGNIRISDVVPVPVYEFADFQTEYTLTIEGVEMTYTADYHYEDGKMVVVVDIKDVDPPEIHINGTAYDEDTNTCTFMFEGSKQMTVKDLLSVLDIYDRVDGAIPAETDHIRLGGQRVAITKKLIAGEVYVVTVSDARGNVATLNVLINNYAADSSDTTPPAFTVDDFYLTYDEDSQAYVLTIQDNVIMSVADLFGMVRASDAECGTIPIQLDNITLNGAQVGIGDSLCDGQVYVITVEDWNLNTASIRIMIEVISAE